jgi:hypothetical protein
VRGRYPWLLALLGLCTAAQAGPRELISECAQRVPAGVAGIEALEPLCAGLTQSLAELSGGAPLAAASLKRVNRDSLREFLRLTDAPSDAGLVAPDPAAVGGILREFGKAPVRELTWWDRFKAWCLKWLIPTNRNSPSLWLPQWLRKLVPSATVAAVIYYTLLGLVVLAVAFMVRNELRAAGLFQRATGKGINPRPSFGGAVSVSLSLEQVMKSPLAQRPALLFRLLAAELSRQGRLGAAASLTHREIAERARLDDSAEREPLSRLSRLAEFQLYGGGLIDPARSEPVLAEGQALYVRLRRQPGRGA